MNLVTAAAIAGTGTRALIASLGRAGAATQGVNTIEEAKHVPSIFRRDTPADVASLKLQQAQTAITAHLLTATGAQAQALGREIARSAEQIKPFSRNTEADRVALQRQQEATAQQLRPFRR